MNARFHPNMEQHSNGFTLLELLVVMSVMAVLVFLGVSVSGRVQEAASKAGCLNNLRQFGVAFQGYANDHNGYLPRSNMGGTQQAWESCLDGYLGVTFTEIQDWSARQVRKTVFNCPAEREPKKPWRCYAINEELRGDGASALAPIRQSEIRFPASYCVLADAYGYGYISTYKASKLIEMTKISRRHGGKPNFLYADGHVAPFDQELKGTSDSGGDPFYKKLWLARYPGN